MSSRCRLAGNRVRGDAAAGHGVLLCTRGQRHPSCGGPLMPNDDQAKSRDSSSASVSTRTQCTRLSR